MFKVVKKYGVFRIIDEVGGDRVSFEEATAIFGDKCFSSVDEAERAMQVFPYDFRECLFTILPVYVEAEVESESE